LDADAYDHEHGIDDSSSISLYRQIRQIAGPRWPASLGSVIEVGCGTGLFSRALLSEGDATEVVLTDISSAMLRQCRGNLNHHGLLPNAPVAFATYSSQEDCFQDSAFDSCIGTSALHHILDLASFLGHVARGLRPQGRAFFMEPNRRFYRAFARAWADIVVLIMAEKPDAHSALQPVLNWLAEQRKAALHDDDLAFLATLEDKHQFTGEQIVALGAQAGFASAEAIPFGSDQAGVVTTRQLAREIGLEANMAERFGRMMVTVGGRYMDLLAPSDASPSLLIWLTRSPEASPVPRPVPLPRASDPPSVDDGGVRTCYHVVVSARAIEGALALDIEGWFLSNLDAKWLRVVVNGRRADLPVWRPRPDVHAAKNQSSRFAAWNALCCGVRDTLVFRDVAAGPYPIEITIIYVGGATEHLPTPPRIELGRVWQGTAG